MKPLAALLAALLAATPAMAHEAAAAPHLHPHGIDGLVMAGLGIALVLVVLRLRRE